MVYIIRFFSFLQKKSWQFQILYVMYKNLVWIIKKHFEIFTFQLFCWLEVQSLFDILQKLTWLYIILLIKSILLSLWFSSDQLIQGEFFLVIFFPVFVSVWNRSILKSLYNSIFYTGKRLLVHLFLWLLFLSPVIDCT